MVTVSLPAVPVMSIWLTVDVDDTSAWATTALLLFRSTSWT
jgi:hypothetical protein